MTATNEEFALLKKWKRKLCLQTHCGLALTNISDTAVR